MRPTTGIAEGEGVGAWLARESVRDLYLTDVLEEAATLPAKTITGSLEDGVPEVRSLGQTLQGCRPEILNHLTDVPATGPPWPEPLHQEGQALRPRLLRLRELPAPRPPLRRRTKGTSSCRQRGRGRVVAAAKTLRWCPANPGDRPPGGRPWPEPAAPGLPRVATARHGSNSLLAQEVEDRHPR